MRRVRLSISEARRIAFAAQGFDRERPSLPDDVRHYRRAMHDVGVLQLDFVNVLIPAHYLMIWSRLGSYSRPRFSNYLYDSGEHLEQWAHEASIVAIEDWPVLAYRRRIFEPWKNSPLNSMPDRDAYLRNVIRHVRQSGATTSNDLPPVAGPKRKPGDWHRSIPRSALEYHFGKGRLAVRRRLKNFQRVYDLPERLIDERYHAVALSKTEAQQKMLRNAARALGVATLHDLADYYRLSPREAGPHVAELVADGTLQPVQVDGWSERAYLASTARVPRQIPGASLLSPFDPLVWYRPRAMRLFNFEYRIEIYVPAARRRWGYYVLPFREGDRITARVDLKADRASSVLQVLHTHEEHGVDVAQTAVNLGAELRALAAWLNLASIEVRKSARLDKLLARAI